MNTIFEDPSRKSMRANDPLMRAVSYTVLATVAAIFVSAACAASSNLTYQAEITLREAFDSNVYLQDLAPDRARVPNAAPPKHGSWVTSIAPRLGLDFKPNEAFSLSAGYSPNVVFYHSESSEDHVTHRGSLRLGGTVRDAVWEMPSQFTWIDGNDVGLFFGGPGGGRHDS